LTLDFEDGRTEGSHLRGVSPPYIRSGEGRTRLQIEVEDLWITCRDFGINDSTRQSIAFIILHVALIPWVRQEADVTAQNVSGR
jgi:hypothetical protein